MSKPDDTDDELDDDALDDDELDDDQVDDDELDDTLADDTLADYDLEGEEIVIFDEPWPSNVTHTFELGSQRGRGYSRDYASFGDFVNAFLDSGWRIISTYVEGKSDPYREECVCLMGWSKTGKPVYPEGYDPNYHPLD